MSKWPLAVIGVLAASWASAVERRFLTEVVGGREIAFELAVGSADRFEVALAPDIDGDGPGIASLVDPERTAAEHSLKVAVNANAFRKPDRKDRNWLAGGAAIVMGEVVTGGVYVAGCEQKRLMFWVDLANVGHIGRNLDFSRVRCAVSDWGGHFLKGGAYSPVKDVTRYPRSIIGHDRTGRKVYLLVGEMTFAEAAEILIRHGASEAMNLDGGGSAVMVPDRRKFHLRRPVAVVAGFR